MGRLLAPRGEPAHRTAFCKAVLGRPSLDRLAGKLLLAWRFPGYLTGDDLEVLRTAAKYAWGLDYQPWGLRCLFHPLTFVRPLLEVAYDLGPRDPALMSWLGTLPAA